MGKAIFITSDSLLIAMLSKFRCPAEHNGQEIRFCVQAGFEETPRDPCVAVFVESRKHRLGKLKFTAKNAKNVAKATSYTSHMFKVYK